MSRSFIMCVGVLLVLWALWTLWHVQALDAGGGARDALSEAYYRLSAPYVGRDKQDIQPALDNLSREIDSAPADKEAYIQRGFILMTRDSAQAYADFSLARDLDPQDARPHYGLAYLSQQEHDPFDYKAYIQGYSTAIELDPSYRDAYVARALVWDNFDGSEQAVRDVTRAIELTPDEGWLYALRAVLRPRDSQAAYLDIADYTQALVSMPDRADYYYWRSVRYAEVGAFAQALEDSTRVIDRDPDNPNAYAQRALVRQLAQTSDIATIAPLNIQDYTQAIQLNPDDGTYHYERATNYASLGRTSEALSDYQQALNLVGDMARHTDLKRKTRKEIETICATYIKSYTLTWDLYKCACFYLG